MTLRSALLVAGLAGLALAAPAPLSLSTGTLSFASGLEGAARGPWVVAYDPLMETTIHATLTSTLAPCGSVAGYLPPKAFLIHVRTDAAACLARIAATPGVLGVAAMSGTLRKDPVLASSASRMLVLSLSEGASYEALVADLAPQIAALCPTCTMQSASASIASISTLENCAAACALDAPSDCGCTVPAALADAIAAHPDVLWLSRYEQAYATNAFAAGMIQTTDLANWGGIQAQFGACTAVAPDTCASTPNLPFSQIGSPAPLLYGPFVAPVPPFTVAESTRALSEATASIDAARGLQGAPCSAPCQTGACGQGFGDCAGLVTPIAATGLTGANQLIQVVDSGLDTGSPFFYDATSPVVPNSAAPITTTSHRKVAAYWSYADAIDSMSGFGHGTHVAGSIAGSALNPLPADAAVLASASGIAPGARLLVTDVYCNTLATPAPNLNAGCTRPNVVPVRAPVCAVNTMCLPTNIADLFTPAVRTGAFISSNSWARGPSTSTYNEESFAIDSFTHDNPDVLLVFSSNGDRTSSGTVGITTLSSQGVAKNALTVGAIADGFLAHQAKTRGLPATGGAVLYQSLDGRACGGVLSYAATLNLTSLAPANACPLAINPTTCFNMYWDGIGENTVDGVLNPVPGGFPATSQYGFGTSAQAELPLCCGCTLQNVVDGCLLAGAPCTASFYDPSSPLSGQQALSLLVSSLQSTYNARFPEIFSSLGPTQDLRNKPDLAAPGLELMSARSGSNWASGNWACPPTSSDFFNRADFQLTTITLTGNNAFATIYLGAAPSTVSGVSQSNGLREPVNVVSLSLPITTVGASATGTWFELQIVSSSENAPLPATQYQPARVRVPFAACGGALPACGPVLFTLPLGGYQMGAAWVGTIQLFAAPGMLITYHTPPPPSSDASFFRCYLPAVSPAITQILRTTVQFTLNVARGGAQAYVSAMSGTSMAAPIIAGTAALVRQYYTNGFLGAGVATPGAGFLPSAALVKATLINAATPLVSQSYDNMFQNTGPGESWSGPTGYLAQGGFGVPQLQRTLSFATLGSATRAAGQLPTLLLPGLIIMPGGAQRGVEPQILMTGITHQYCIDTTLVPQPGPPVSGVTIPMVISLVWTDRPSLPQTPTSLPTLINNLDLIVVAPSGAKSRGNPPNGSSSGGNPPFNQTADVLNNVEVLTFTTPAATINPDGSRALPAYVLYINGTSLPMPPQAYSLVVSGPGLSLGLFQGGVCVAQSPTPSPSPSPSPSPPPPPAPAGTVPQSTLVITASVLGAALFIVIIAAVVYFVGCSCSRGGSGGGSSPTAAAKSVKSAWPEGAAKGGAVTTPNALRASLNAADAAPAAGATASTAAPEWKSPAPPAAV